MIAIAKTKTPETFFCDTSVLVAAADAAHEHHAPSQNLVAAARPRRAFCAAHGLAELYSTLSAGRYLRVLPLTQVVEIVSRVRQTFTVVDVPHDEYAQLIESLAPRQIRGGRIYDALQVHAATLCGADWIYTWNETDFLAVAPPHITARIRTPTQP